MNRAPSKALVVFLLLCSTSFWGGCSIVGLIAGATADRRSRSPWELTRVAPGEQMSIRLRDDTRVRGTFRGLVDVPADEYRVSYEAARSALLAEARLPALGSVGVTWADGERSSAELVGFLPSAVVLVHRGQPKVEPVSKIAYLTGQGETGVSRAVLERLLDGNRLPYVKAIEILGVQYSGNEPPKPKADEVMRLGFAEVVDLRIASSRGLVTGFFIGVLVDGLLFAIVKDALNHMELFDGGGSSCPYVYSFDGERFVLDAEPLAGAILPAVARAEVSRLDHLRPHDGAYRLRIANELREVEHIDAVRLMVLDHRPGLEVVPDFDGGLHVVSDLRGPTVAVDQRGSTVTSRLASAEGDPWSSNPFHRNEALAEDQKDALVADFVRPVGAREAVVVIEAQSTPWVVAVLHDFLAGQSDLDGWYRQVAAEPDRHTYRALASRLVPELQAWTGQEWRAVGSLGPLPTAKSTVRAYRVSLSGLPEGVLRTRITGMPGAWSVDRMAVAFGPGIAAAPMELRPRSVVSTAAGRDAADLLGAADGESLTLRKGDFALLEFDVPPLSPGRSRTLLLRTKGWYQILLDPEQGTRRVALASPAPEEIERRSLARLREMTPR